MKLQPMDTAPKDRCILLDVGLPWLVVGHYLPQYDYWVYASLQAGLLLGEFNDYYFENEHEAKPRGWVPMPEIS